MPLSILIRVESTATQSPSAETRMDAIDRGGEPP
jgi:hypothetical protein